MEVSRQEYWSGLPFPTPGKFSKPGIETKSLVSPAVMGRLFTTVPPGKSSILTIECFGGCREKYGPVLRESTDWWEHRVIKRSSHSMSNALSGGPEEKGKGRDS